MIERPAFDSRHRVTVVPGDGVYFVADRAVTSLMPDRIYADVARLIDGRRTSLEIGDALEARIDLAVIYYAILQLERHGYIREATDATPVAEVASAADVERIVALLGARAAQAMLVIADDYLAPELELVNQQALTDRHPWLLAKMTGEQIWIGPLFIPGETACWCCLAQRHRTVRPLEAYLERRRAIASVLSSPVAVPREAFSRLAQAIERDRQRTSIAAGVVLRFDVMTSEISYEVAERRPQCPACGDPTLYRRRLERFDLTRAPAVQERPWGVAATISRVPVPSELFHVYVATPAAVYDAPDGPTLALALRQRCVGSGITSADASRAVIAETIERYSGTMHGDEPCIRATLDSFAQRGIHPNACMLYSEAQYASRRAINAVGEPAAMVPEPFDSHAMVDWTPVWSLTRGEPRYLPTAFLYRGAGNAAGAEMCVADSNGCAAGASVADAVVRGFLELIERDSIALWWYRRLQRPRVDLASLASSYCRDVHAAYRSMARDLWVLDITSDLQVPAYAAVSIRTDPDAAGREIAFGFGAHFDAERAVTHAVTELNQLVASLHMRVTSRASRSPHFDRWMETATVDGHAYVAPQGIAELPRALNRTDVADDLERCRQIVERRGMELLVLDQTRADVALPVVKVIVPGLRPAARRLGPGRLYLTTIPGSGTLDECDEQSLNALPFFL